MEYEKLTEEIIGCAYNVYNRMGFGFLESVYEKCIVDDTIILELKSVRRIAKAHEIQLVNYLVATGKPVGLLINFGEHKVEIKRKLRELE